MKNKLITKNIIKTLILENCLIFGQPPKFTSKKVLRYLLGTRGTLEIFRIKEIEHNLLRIYPLIQTLFRTTRIINTIKIKRKIRETKRNFLLKNQENLYSINLKNFTHNKIQILFVTTTPAYENIIKSAALLCQMPFNNKTWLSGSLTSQIAPKKEEIKIGYKMLDVSLKTQKYKLLNRNKIIKDVLPFVQKELLPLLIIIPDINNNKIIIKETQQTNTPIIGLINTNSTIKIDYPIFGNTHSIHVVHFFCHFLAKLIAKEIKDYNRTKIFSAFFSGKKNNYKKEKIVRKYLRNKNKNKNKYKNYKPLFVYYKSFYKKLYAERVEQYHILDEKGRRLIKVINLLKKLTFPQIIIFLKRYIFMFISAYNIYSGEKDSNTTAPSIILIKESNAKKRWIGQRKNFIMRKNNHYTYRIFINMLRTRKWLWRKWFGKTIIRKHPYGKNNIYYWKPINLKRQGQMVKQKLFIHLLFEQLKYYKYLRDVAQENKQYWYEKWHAWKWRKRKNAWNKSNKNKLNPKKHNIKNATRKKQKEL